MPRKVTATTAPAAAAAPAPSKAEPVEEPVEKKTKKATPAKAEPVPVAAPVEEHVESAAESEKEESDEATLASLLQSIQEMNKMGIKLFQKSEQETKKAQKLLIAIEKKHAKEISKKSAGGKKKRTGSNGLDKLVPVQTNEFKTFVEKNYQQLSDKDGNQIITDLTYDAAHGDALMISRKNALRLVNAYVRHHKLQTYESKKRIHMDKTLEKLFPEYASKKDKSGKVTEEESFYFYNIMKALSPHLKKEDETSDA